MGTKHFNVSVLIFLRYDYEKVAENSRCCILWSYWYLRITLMGRCIYTVKALTIGFE